MIQTPSRHFLDTLPTFISHALNPQSSLIRARIRDIYYYLTRHCSEIFQAPSSTQVGGLMVLRVLGRLYFFSYSPPYSKTDKDTQNTQGTPKNTIKKTHKGTTHLYSTFSKGLILSRKVRLTEDLGLLTIGDVLGFLVVLNFQWGRYVSLIVPGRGIGGILIFWSRHCDVINIHLLSFWITEVWGVCLWGVSCQCLDDVLDIANGIIIS